MNKIQNVNIRGKLPNQNAESKCKTNISKWANDKVDYSQPLAKKSSSVRNKPQKQIKELKWRESVAGEKLVDQYFIHDIKESAYESPNKRKKIIKSYTRKNGVYRKKYCTYDLTEDEPRKGREGDRSLEQIDEAEEDEGDKQSAAEKETEEYAAGTSNQETSQRSRPESKNSCENISDDERNDSEVNNDSDLVECDSSDSEEKPPTLRAKRTMPSSSVEIQECDDCEEKASPRRETQKHPPSKTDAKKSAPLSSKAPPVSEKIAYLKKERANPITHVKDKSAGLNHPQQKIPKEEVVRKDAVKVKTKPLTLEVAQFSSQAKSRGRPSLKCLKKTLDFPQPQPTHGVSSNQLLDNLLSQAEAFSTVFGCSTADVIKLLKVHDYNVDKVRTQLMKISLQKASATSLMNN
jgi:hypothetical protein